MGNIIAGIQPQLTFAKKSGLNHILFKPNQVITTAESFGSVGFEFIIDLKQLSELFKLNRKRNFAFQVSFQAVK